MRVNISLLILCICSISCSSIHDYYIDNWEELSFQAIVMIPPYCPSLMMSKFPPQSLPKYIVGQVKYSDSINYLSITDTWDSHGIVSSFNPFETPFVFDTLKINRTPLVLPEWLADSMNCHLVKDDNSVVFEEPSGFYYYSPLLKTNSSNENEYALYKLSKEIYKIESYSEYWYCGYDDFNCISLFSTNIIYYHLTKDTLSWDHSEKIELKWECSELEFPIKEHFEFHSGQ